MEREVINNLLRVIFPQYRLHCFNTSMGSLTTLYTEDDAEVLQIDICPKSTSMFVYISTITPEDIDILESVFNMHRTGLFRFELRGIK